MSKTPGNPPKKGDTRRGEQQANQSKNRPKRRTKKKSTPGNVKLKDFNPEDAEQRDRETGQCFHVLGNKSFKLFKKGQSVTSYGLTLDVRLPERVAVKLIMNVPHEYPRSPIQLQWKKNTSGDNQPREAAIQTLVRNFNFKARDMSLQKTPIIAQLNYLVCRAENLAASGFKLIDRREQEFYAALS